MSTLAAVSAILALAAGIATFIAFAIQLGRVLQRQDSSEELAREHVRKIDALERSRHEAAQLTQAALNRVAVLEQSHERAQSEHVELRRAHVDTGRELTSLRQDLIERLARIEAWLERAAVGSPQSSMAHRGPTIPR